MSRPDIFVVVIAGLAMVLTYAFAQDGAVGGRLRDGWRRLRPYVSSYIGSSPASFVYGGILMVTTWVIAGSNQRLADALLRAQSTNLTNLRHHAIDVLVRSAFWSGTSYALPTIALLAVVLAPAEFWLGTRRAITVFAIGHIGATLLTAAGIALAVHFGRAPRGIERTIDVGVSYGAYCIAGVLTYRLPAPWRYAWAAGLLAVFSATSAVTGEFSDYGHLTSVLLGLACYPLTTSLAVRERAHVPLYRPWVPAATAAASPGIAPSLGGPFTRAVWRWFRRRPRASGRAAP
jgi:hypothetical protein